MVSEVGLGGGGLGHIFGESTDELVAEAIDYALSAGVNYIDVAPAYGEGQAEENLGKALEGRRDEVVVATKFLLTPEDMDDIPGTIERRLGESLTRLRTDHIDLFQMHNMVSQKHGFIKQTTVMGTKRESLGLTSVLGSGGAVEGLERVKASGAVRFIGFTGVGESSAAREIMQSGALDAVQVYYNLLNTSAATPRAEGSTLHDHGQLLPLAQELGMAAIAIRNLAAGALTPKVDRDVPPDSLVGRDLARAEKLAFLSESGTSISQLATRFVLQHPAVTTVVPGVKNRAEMEDAILAMDLPAIGEADLARVQQLADESFGVDEPAGSAL
jgi:aryl-alcohol dehydrogenase-like predicted oxidoreductase